ncbi:MAG: Crp/Fnr family transcriptional regulator [Burkholderiales bacterium]|nr:Crp/Fnr family transcriptional regulator [Burkholderiales bacterium]
MNNETPAQDVNHLLASLTPADWQLIRPQLHWVELPQGACLHKVGDVLQHVYFPVTAIVSLVSTMRDGASAEVAVVGNEGVVGISALIGGDRAHSAAVVQGAGFGWRMPAADIAAHAARSGAVMRPLLRYAQALAAHMAQTVGCNRHHRLEQQLCRWLLLQADRSPSHELKVTQERIAEMLGVRREGVTAGALSLQKDGLIRYARGRIAVLDRGGLEARSCECYAVISQSYGRLRAASPTLGRMSPLWALSSSAARAPERRLALV